MTRPGHMAMMVGVGWFTAGAIVVLLVLFFLPGIYYLFAIGLMAVGLVPFTIGLWQLIAYQIKTPADKAHYHAEIELRALVRAMVAMADADGGLSRSELGSISKIYAELMGHPLKPGMAEKIADTMHHAHYSIDDDLAMSQEEISNGMKDNIIKACYLVMVADGEITENEKIRINDIAHALHVPAQHAIELVEQLRTKEKAKPKSKHKKKPK